MLLPWSRWANEGEPTTSLTHPSESCASSQQRRPRRPAYAGRRRASRVPIDSRCRIVVAVSVAVTVDRLLNVLPLFHAHGLISGLLTALAYRVTTIVIAAIGAGYYLTARSEIRRAVAE